MTKIKTERNLKVYGYESKWHDYPAEIRLKGKWLKEFGFNAGDHIIVTCANDMIIITKKRLQKTYNPRRILPSLHSQ